MLNAEGTCAFIVGLAGVFVTAGALAANKGIIAGAVIGSLLGVLFLMGIIVGKNME